MIPAMRYPTTAVFACLLAFTGEDAAAQHIVPQPVKMTAQPGQFELTARTVIWADASSAPVARQ